MGFQGRLKKKKKAFPPLRSSLRRERWERREIPPACRVAVPRHISIAHNRICRRQIWGACRGKQHVDGRTHTHIHAQPWCICRRPSLFPLHWHSDVMFSAEMLSAAMSPRGHCYSNATALPIYCVSSADCKWNKLPAEVSMGLIGCRVDLSMKPQPLPFAPSPPLNIYCVSECVFSPTL